MFRLFALFFLFAFSGVAGTALFAGDISPSLKSGEFWTLPWNELAQRHFAGARYRKISENEICIVRDSGVSLGGLNSFEIILTRDKTDKLESALAMIYNKGDDGAISRKIFEGKVEATRAALDEFVGKKGVPVKISLRESAVEVEAWEWVWDGGAMRLEAAATQKRKEFVAEFIRLSLAATKKDLERGNASDAARRSDLTANVKREENGDVVIEGIPMVDQGQKGYCVPATLSRLFAYYGMDGVDQHALAALCASSGTSGTSTATMFEEIKKIAGKFRLKISELDERASLNAWIADYNKLAKRQKKAQLSASSSAWTLADKDLLRAARAGKTAQVERWMKPIRRNIDAGVPVLWSVTLGIFPEKISTPQTRGGHLRLIIGYNDKTKTVLFSDSWGMGHEKKELPAADAAAMTHQRFLLRPST